MRGNLQATKEEGRHEVVKFEGIRQSRTSDSKS